MYGLSEEALFEGLSNTSDNVYIFENDIKNDVSKWSDNAVRYFGLPEDYGVRTLEVWVQHIHPEDREAYLEDISHVFSGKKARHYCQYRAKNSEGDYVWVECIGNIIRNPKGEPAYFVGMITRLDNQSKYDPVTKCLSIQQFYQAQMDRPCGLLLIGLDKFRSVINNFGYETGNKVLIGLVNVIGRMDMPITLYRMTGDEFLLVLPDMTQEAAANFFYELLIAFQSSANVQEHWKKPRFSGGFVRYVPGENNKETAIRQLEHSMEHAKSRGSGLFVAFSQAIEEKHTRILKIKEALVKAMEHGYEGFELYYQPVVNAADDTIFGVEALLRFSCKELGMVFPNEFIPILEETRDIRKVGNWVMEQAIRQKALWQKEYPELGMGFNVSYLQLYTDELINHIIETAKRFQVAPNHIIIELTESCKVEYPQSLASMLKRLVDQGFKIILDDFGMEHSSFSLVRDLPVDGIKVDHSFVRTLTDGEGRKNQVNLAVISSINYLCRQLGISVVVEGVENRQIADRIRDMNVRFLQGYYYSRPVPAGQIEELLRSGKAQR